MGLGDKFVAQQEKPEINSFDNAVGKLYES
jgi:hypothetical protein